MPARWSRIAVLLLLLPFVPAALAQVRLPDGIERITTVEGITEYLLANGLKVLLFPDASKPTITVNVTYLVGSVNESYGETGMAHLLEHMLFKGAPKHRDVYKELQDHGAQANGTTSWDRTNYYETFNASDTNLEWALDLEADRMVNSFVAQADLDSEMTVVRNEFEQGENNPISVLFNRLLSAAYLWHGYGNTPIGSRSDIEGVPIERLQAFYQRFYQPDNAVLVVAGRVEEAGTLGLIAQHFGPIPRPTRVLRENHTVEPTQDGEREVVVRRIGDIQALLAGFHAPAGAHEDFVPLQLAADTLTDAPSGRLYRALVETSLATAVDVEALQLKDPGMVILLAMVRQDASLDSAREALFKTLAELPANPITDAEVDRARNRMLSIFEQQMNNSQAIAIQLSNWAAIGDWRMMFLDRDRVRGASTAAVQQAALRYLKPANRTLAVFIPGEPDRTDVPARPDIASLLQGYTGDAVRAEGEVFDPTPANIEARTVRRQLPGGVKLVLLPKATRGAAVNAAIRLNFGTEQSLRGNGRIGALTAQMLMRGTRSHTRQQIEDELDRHQSRLMVAGGPDAAVANIQSTHEHLAAVLALAIEVLREPAFPDGEFRTLRDALLTNLESTRSEPQAIVQRAFTRHFARNYPAGDVRYAPSLEEEMGMIRDATPARLGEFHAAFYGASNAEVVVVGDFDPASVEAMISERLDSWRSPQPYQEIPNPYPDPAVETTSAEFETPDKENAFFLAGMPIRMTDAHTDYPALVLGNYILGQGVNSRLFRRIRDREGLSYGIGSQFQAQAHADGARFLLNAIAAPQNVAQVDASTRDELTTILREGYSDAEIAAAKDSLIQARRVARSQDPVLASTLLGLAHNDRTIAWDAALEERLRALTAAEVRDAMRRHIDPETLTVMRGGDFARAAGN